MMPFQKATSAPLFDRTLRKPRLGAAYFRRPAPVVAQALIGAVLVHRDARGERFGRIVETEAYDETDPASHSFRRPTPRTQAMFGPGGHAYVYRSYGVHWCLNVCCERDGVGAAVLIRAIEPWGGLPLMAEARHLTPDTPGDLVRLCRGPGNVTQAFGIGLLHNGQSMRSRALGLYPGPGLAPDEHIETGPRIGISVAQDVPWRFYIGGCPYVSGRRGRALSASRQA